MVELGIAAWIVEFLRQTKGFSITHSSLYLTLFFGFVMLGRLLGSFVVDRIGYLRSMVWAIIGATICIAVGVFGPPALAIVLSCAGLFLSIIFPTTVAAVSQLHAENTGTILGLLFTCAGVGGALGPWTIGIVSDLIGINLGFALSIGYGLVVLMALLVLLRMTSRQALADTSTCQA